MPSKDGVGGVFNRMFFWTDPRGDLGRAGDRRRDVPGQDHGVEVMTSPTWTVSVPATVNGRLGDSSVFWIRQITGILQAEIQAEAEIQVQVVGVTMDAAQSLRGQGLLSAVISSMDLAPAAQALRGQASIWAVITGDREVEYPVHLEGRGEIQVQVVGVTMDAAEALRGQGLLSAVISSMDLAPAAQSLRGQASIWAVITGDREVEYPVHLEGRGEILASGVAMILSAGVRALAGRGAVTAGGISTALQALVDLRGQGRVTASPTAMALTDPVARLLAGRGAITITGATRNLNTPIYARVGVVMTQFVYGAHGNLLQALSRRIHGDGFYGSAAAEPSELRCPYISSMPWK
jgi:hypothetical protein